MYLFDLFITFADGSTIHLAESIVMDSVAACSTAREALLQTYSHYFNSIGATGFTSSCTSDLTA